MSGVITIIKSESGEEFRLNHIELSSLGKII